MRNHRPGGTPPVPQFGPPNRDFPRVHRRSLASTEQSLGRQWTSRNVHWRPQSVLAWMPGMDAGNICASKNQCIAIREGTVPFPGLFAGLCGGFGPFLEASAAAASASAASKSKLCKSKHTFDFEKVQSSQNIKIERMYIETSSDVTLESQIIEMVEDGMLIRILVWSE